MCCALIQNGGGGGGGGGGARQKTVLGRKLSNTISIMSYVSQQVLKLIAGVGCDIYKIK